MSEAEKTDQSSSWYQVSEGTDYDTLYGAFREWKATHKEICSLSTSGNDGIPEWQIVAYTDRLVGGMAGDFERYLQQYQH